MTYPQNNKPTILAVDDDISGLKYFSMSLRKMDFHVLSATGVDEAQAIILKKGILQIDCVLTDFRMPVKSGLDLLDWVMRKDSSLSTIIVTAEGEKNLVRDSLRSGASDYLEKPVSRQVLGGAISRGVERTIRNRQLLATDQEVGAVGRMDQIFQAVRAPEILPYFKCYYRPLYKVGGDFINVLPIGDERFLFLAGDVSGHDVRAAFVSAYFQGMMRGLLEHNTSLQDVLQLFNRILGKEWVPDEDGSESSDFRVQSSLAICAAVVEYKSRKVHMINCGIPPPWISYRDGSCRRMTRNYSPLGWFPVEAFGIESLSLDDLAGFYICTDGLTDYADYLRIDPFSLIYKLLSSSDEVCNRIVTQPPDDILVMHYQVDQDSDLENLYQPLIFEHYSGDEFKDIDRLQGIWRRSLQFALSEELGDKIYDVLLCCREAVLNALVYGCDKSPEKTCTIQVTVSQKLGRIGVRIDDPGHGHGFDITERVEKMKALDGSHLGLAIIDNLCDKCSIENDGTSLIFELAMNN